MDTRRRGVSLVEVLMAGLVLGTAVWCSFILYRGGALESRTSTEHLSAMSNALLLTSLFSCESFRPDSRAVRASLPNFDSIRLFYQK